MLLAVTGLPKAGAASSHHPWMPPSPLACLEQIEANYTGGLLGSWFTCLPATEDGSLTWSGREEVPLAVTLAFLMEWGLTTADSSG